MATLVILVFTGGGRENGIKGYVARTKVLEGLFFGVCECSSLGSVGNGNYGHSDKRVVFPTTDTS